MDRGAGCIIAIGQEPTYATPVNDTMLLSFSSETLKCTPDKKSEENLLAGKSPAGHDLMGLKVAGDISGILKPENLGFLVGAALGGPDTVDDDYGGVTGQAQHTIIAADADGAMPSYSIRVDRKVDKKLYTGCKCASLKLSAKAGDYVKVSSSWKGYQETPEATITTTTRPSLKAFRFIGATVSVGGTSIEMTDFELTIDNSLDDGVQTSVTGLGYSEPLHGTRKFGVTIGAPYATATDTIIETYAKGEGKVVVVLHFESSSVIAGTSKYRADITLNNCAVLGDPPNISGVGLISHSIKLEAEEIGSTEPISAVIYDATETPYVAA